jgi:hypothetical protein
MIGDITRLLAVPACVLLAMLSSGCAVVTTGTTQTVTIESSPKQGAKCDIGNGKGTWQVASTPQAITVARAYADLSISCRHPDGSFGSMVVPSATKGVIIGTAILTGAVGVVADVASGAAYDYPTVVTVALQSNAGAAATAAPAQTWAPPAAGLKLVTRDGHLQVQSVDGEMVVTTDHRGQWAKWLHGAILVRHNSVSTKATAGEFLPIAVGRSTLFIEQVNYTGTVLEHRVRVQEFREVAVDGVGKVGAFELLDEVTMRDGSGTPQVERRRVLYAPSLGLVLSYSVEPGQPSGTAVAWEVVKVERPS